MPERDANTYRQRYLSLLDEQERQEKQHALQLELLKKTLFRLGVTASGMHEPLDTAVSKLREVMRGGTGAQASKQLERINTAADNFAQLRANETQKTVTALAGLVEQYQALQLPSEHRQALRDFSKSLAERLSHYRTYPAVLEELAQLQARALDAAAKPQASLWTRIRGGRTLDTEVQAKGEAATLPHAADDVSDSIDRDTAIDDDANSHTDSDTAAPASADTHSGTQSNTKPQGDDETQTIIQRITYTLTSLLEHIEPNASTQHKIASLQQRLSGSSANVDWRVIAEMLEELRDILFLRYLKVDDEFTGYLNQVRGELTDIRGQLAQVISLDEASTETEQRFTLSIEQGVDAIQKTVSEGTDLATLKHDVDEQITEISKALAGFKARAQTPLSDQLNDLIHRMKAIEKESEDTKKALQIERHRATHDALTGLPNRQAYLERAALEHERFQRFDHALTVAVCDIDFFKRINDGFGHQAGDKVLQLIAKVISGKLRSVDFIARFGGEEFVVILPESTANDALTALEKIRTSVAETPLRFKQKPLQVTISFGIAEFVPGEDFDSAFSRADAALYQAKSQGRNCSVLAR